MDSQSADANFAYSPPSGTSVFKKDDYISRLADDLVHHVYYKEVKDEILRQVCSVLPDLLKGFALKLGHKAATENHIDIKLFVLKYQNDITSRFRDHYLNNDLYDKKITARNSNNMPLVDIMNMWGKYQDKNVLEGIASTLRDDREQHNLYSEPKTDYVSQSTDEEKGSNGEDIIKLSLQQYWDIIYETEPYEWLISRLRREFLLTSTELNIMNEIKQKITSHLPKPSLENPTRSSTTYKVMFTVDWDLLDFLKTQQYEDKPYQADMAITLTGGSYKDAQALTCAQYLSQTWPGSGEHVMLLLLDVIRKPRARCSWKLPDNTMITAWIDKPQFSIEALGCETSVVEIGEQIAWISAALRASTAENKFSYCKPYIDVITENKATKEVTDRRKMKGHGSFYQKNRLLRTGYAALSRLNVGYQTQLLGHKAHDGPSLSNAQVWPKNVLEETQGLVADYHNLTINSRDVSDDFDSVHASHSPYFDNYGTNPGMLVPEKPPLYASQVPHGAYLKMPSTVLVHILYRQLLYENRNYHNKSEATESSSITPITKFEMSFQADEAGEKDDFSNGECWRGLFKNPVVVLGYPIQRRSKKGMGLEIPLNMMAGLAQAQCIDIYSGKIFIKGFSTMLIPTVRGEDAIIWHLVYTKDGSRISYLDGGVSHAEDIKALDLEKSRHILGWCLEARFYAGAPDANYPIQSSELPHSSNDCVLAGITASFGRTIVEGSPFCIGQKDTPLHLSRGGYIECLRWISRQFIIFWDEADKRGWLVNGASALLHLVRASMVHKKTDDFCEAFLFNADEVEEAPEKHSANSSISVLINKNNQALKVYPEGDGYINFRHEIDKFYNILEKLVDYQTGVSGRRGEKLKDHPRKYLEGWEFQDLAVAYDPISPRLAILKTAGKGWVDFTRAINAVVLFGRGFGDLIRPTKSSLCDSWEILPKLKYYLATGTKDLYKILKQNGSYIAQSKSLDDGILMYHPDEPLESCQCFISTETAHSDPVRVFMPSSLSERFPVGKTAHLVQDEGAVIFGQNAAFNWFWRDTGNPEKMESPPPEDVEITPHDSGIGESASSSGSTSEKTLALPSFLEKKKSFDISHNVSTPLRTVQQKENYDRERVLTIEDYTVGIICALPKELRAVRTLFDESYDKFENFPQDTNQYSFGAIGQHNVVAACLPWNDYGTISGATITTNMKRSFPALRFCLLVGIGGGVPSRQNDIRLGDVVVGVPKGIHPGVIQYDLGKSSHSGKFERTGSLPKPPPVLMTALSSLESDPDPMATPSQLQKYIQVIQRGRKEYEHPERKFDKLFSTEDVHSPSQETCEECRGREVKRDIRSSDIPQVHYGLIASGDSVVKDAGFRDRLSAQENVLCFEMEAAGVANVLPCLVIRGICDYADSHKNDLWQEYAAATAASYAKHLLSFVSTLNRPLRKRPASDVSVSGEKRTRLEGYE